MPANSLDLRSRSTTRGVSLFSAFVDELEKVSVSHGQWSISKARSGRRSMSVETMLRKDKDGTLVKKADLVDDEHESKMRRRLNRLREMRGMPGSKAHAEMMKREKESEILDAVNPLKTGVVGKLAAVGGEQMKAYFKETDPKNPTVMPTPKSKKGDYPSREDVPGRVGAEYRPDVSGTTPSRGMAPEGYTDG